MKTTTNPWLVLGLAALLCCVAPLTVGCGGGGSTGGVAAVGGGAAPVPPPPTPVDPRFAGVKSVAVAGPSAVQLRWDAATDDVSPASAISYRVYAAATAGGQNFATPLLTTAAGATSAVVTSGLTSGAPTFYVVRAVDAAGNEEDNTVELAALPLASANVFYVESGAGGTGTLASPFSTIQEGVNAAEAAGGGIVLVATATYNEKVNVTVGGVSGVEIFGGFPSWTTLQGADQATILAARDPRTHVTTITGDGLVFTPPEGLVQVLNGEPTFFDGFTVTESGDDGLRGVDVNLQVSGNRFTDGAGANTPDEGIMLDTSAVTTRNEVAIVGNEFDSMPEGVEFGGATSTFSFRGNHLHDLDSTGVRSATALAVLDADSVVVPTAGTAALTFERNRFDNTNQGVLLDFEPEVPASAGNLALTFRYNDMRFFDGGDCLQVQDLGFFGQGGTGSLNVHDNYLRGASDDLLEVDYLESDTDSVPDGALAVTFRDNWAIHTNSNGLDVESFSGRAGLASTFTVEDCTFANFESDAIEVDREFNGTAGAFDGANLAFTVRNNQFFNGDDNVDLDVDAPPSGSVTLDVLSNNFQEANYGMLVEIDSDGFCGVPAAGTPTAVRTVRLTGNRGLSGDDDAFNLDVAPSGAGGATLLVANNHVTAGDDNALDLDIDSNPDSAGTILVVLANNWFNNSDDDGMEIDNLTDDDEEVDFYLGHVSALGSYENEACTLDSRANTLLVLGNTALGQNDVDSSDALRLDAFQETCGDMTIRNSAFAYAAGDGIEIPFAFYPQIVNNVVYENSQDGGSTSEFGINASGSTAFSQVYVANSIVTRNPADLDTNPLIRGIFSLIGQGGAFLGFGSLSADPQFLGAPDLQDFNAFFRLGAASPARDAGNPAAAWNDPDGSRNDMGAFGGPGAGTLGYQAGVTTTPLVALGLRPYTDLYTGQPLVAPGVPVTVVFTEAINAGTVSTATLPFLVNGAAVNGAYAVNGHRVTFTPGAPFAAGTTVTVQATTGLQSTDGSALSFPWQQAFAVEPTAVAEVEGNNTPATAQPLATTPFRIAGNGGTGDLLDYYSFTATAGQRLTATVLAQRFGISAGNFRLTLLDTDGTTVLTTDNDSFGVLNSGNRFDPFNDFTIPANGTYFLLVEEEAGAGPFDYQLEGWLR